MQKCLWWVIVYFQVNIFNLSEADTKDIDRAILYALLKGKISVAQL